MIRIFLNSIANSPEPLVNYGWFEVTDDCNGIENLTMSVSYVDNVVQRGITNQVSFVDAAYDFIFDKLVNDVNGEHIWVRVEIDGFDYVFPYMQIKYNAIEWCSDRCSLEAELVTWDSDIDAYRKLKNELIWDEDFLNSLEFYNQWENNTEQAHPLMRVNRDRGSIEWKWGMIGVFARHYFYNLCKKVDLTPKSTIFNYQGLNAWTGDDYDDDKYVSSSNKKPWQTPQSNKLNPYHRAAIFLNKNRLDANETSGSIDWLLVGQNTRPTPTALYNALNLNGFQYLQRLSPVFNAKFRVINGELVFERKDYFYQTSTQWLDLSDKKVCLKLKTQNNWAYLRLEYGDEATMWQGSLPERGSLSYTPSQVTTTIPPYPIFAEKYYTEMVEWNDPPSSRQSGEKTEILEFASLRTQTNGVVKGGPSWEKYGLSVYNLSAEEPFIACLREDEPMSNSLLWLNNEEAALSEPSSNPEFTQNKPMWTKQLSEAHLNPNFAATYKRLWRGTLYDNFHFIDDPRRRPNSQGYEAKEPYKRFEYEMDIDLDCDSLDTFSLDKYILTSEGKASIESVIFDFKKMTGKIKGFI